MTQENKVDGRPAWAEVRQSALTHNLRAIRRRLDAKTTPASERPKILAVVKANAYGHGAVPVARTLARAGADWFGVTCATEGIELREGGIRKPILVLTGFWKGEERYLLKYRLTPTVTRCEQVKALERAAARARQSLSFHLKVETGMNRLGMPMKDLPCLARLASDCRYARLQGIFTHFAASEVFTDDSVERQQENLKAALACLRSLGISPPLVHAANSAAVVCRPDTWGTMVRPGLLLYGYHQSFEPPERTAEAHAILPLEPALSLRTRLISLRDVATGQAVGYNGRWVAPRPSRVAVLSIGYADGVPRTLTNRGRVIVRGKFAPMVGTVSMDLVTADVTEIRDAQIGDVATFYGSDGEASQWISDVAQQLGTVTSDLCCAIGRRVPRLYVP